MYNISDKLNFISKLTIIFAIMLSHFSQKSLYAAVPKHAFFDRYAEIVIDANSNKIVFSANENVKRYPASLTKLMTIYLLFEAIKSGRLSLNSPIPISYHAAHMPPTKLGLKIGEVISAEDAVKAMITKSANDVAVAVAEYLGHDEKNFANLMTKKAHKLGMMNTHFSNASGLPDRRNYSTAHDLAILAMALKNNFPQLYYLFKITQFRYNKKIIRGHNRLVAKMKGVDGLKTGYTVMSGYNLATSYNAHGRSLIAVLMGAKSVALRDLRMANLLHRFVPQANFVMPKQKRTANGKNKKINLRLNLYDMPLTNFKKQDNLFELIEDSSTAKKKLHMTANAKIESTKNHIIQIGTSDKVTKLHNFYSRIIRAFPQLSKYHKEILNYRDKSKNFFRLRLYNFASKNEAKRACAELKSKKYNCFVVN